MHLEVKGLSKWMACPHCDSPAAERVVGNAVFLLFIAIKCLVILPYMINIKYYFLVKPAILTL